MAVGGGPDLTTPGDGGGGCAPASAQKITGFTFNWDQVKLVSGTVAAVQGYEQACNSATSTAAGGFTLPIPQPALGMELPIILTGTANGQPVLRTVFVRPHINLSGGDEDTALTVHMFLGGDAISPCPAAPNSCAALPKEFGAELDAKGGIIGAGDGASAATFGSKWNWAVIAFARHDKFGMISGYYGAQISKTGDGGNCKVYYLNSFANFGHGAVPKVIDFAATNAHDPFALLLCPASQTTPVTLTASGNIVDDSASTATYGNSAVVPMSLGNAVYVEWSPTQCSGCP
jgi:hypothetical protein